MNLIDRYNQILLKIPSTVKLVAVSKTITVSIIEELYLKTGHNVLGENKVQELIDKHQMLPSDLEWHFIGHLQTNKIKFIAPFISLIQSIDSEKLLVEINKEAKKVNRVVPCLLQFHIAKEEAKFGFSLDEVKQILDTKMLENLNNIAIHGVMGMATFTNDQALIRSEFKKLRVYFDTLKTAYFSRKPEFKEISMGMTEDYLLAIEEGSTMIRVGAGIFGNRQY